jgi:hypothetical protein
MHQQITIISFACSLAYNIQHKYEHWFLNQIVHFFGYNLVPITVGAILMCAKCRLSGFNSKDLFCFELVVINRAIQKVRKTQHQNPEFGHTQGEIKKKPCQKVH